MFDVMSVAVPSPSLVERSLIPNHYFDAFSLDVPVRTFGTVDRLVHGATRLSTAGKALMAFRDLVVRPFGLITAPAGSSPADDPDVPLAVDSVVGIFRIIARTNDEVLMGLDDKHLNFRFSLMLRARPDREVATATTLVYFNNVGGRIYFALVKPAHRLIVPAMLRIAAARARVNRVLSREETGILAP